MHFIDLAAQQERIRPAIEERIRRVLDHGQYILGPENQELEERLAAFTGVRHALACSSGTDALLLALLAYGVGPGDAVFTTPFTFVATAEVIALTGAVPVFVDIEPETFNLDPVALQRAVAALAARDPGLHPLPQPALTTALQPRGIIAVDLFGVPADYPAINGVAAAAGLFVVEDAAQSFGAQRGGRRAGGLAAVGATSFFPAKPLGGYGDGGAVFTDDDGLAARMASLRVHGQGASRYEHLAVGINGRLDTLQAAVLLCKLDIFEEELAARQEVAAAYARYLGELGEDLRLPRVPAGAVSAWAQYSVLAADSTARERYRRRLDEAGIPSGVYYPVPLHLQPAFAGLGYRTGSMPVAEAMAARIFSLPMHPYLTEAQVARVAAVLAGRQ